MTAKDDVSTESLGGFLEEMTPKLHPQGEVGSWLTRLTKDKNDKTLNPTGCPCMFICVPEDSTYHWLPLAPPVDGENEGLLISALSSLFE